MSKKTSIFIFLLFLFSALAFYKVKLVYDYKKDFEQLSKIERKLSILKDQNAKLKLEISLIDSSPYIYEKALKMGMIEPQKINKL